MSLRATALAAAALVAAVALGWVGRDLLALPSHGSRVSDTLVGGRDARRFDEALRLFQASVGRATSSNGAFAARARAEAALAAQTGGPRLRSQAETLLGVLGVEDARSQQGGGAAAAAAAAAAFRRALRLDPDNEDAAADLELLLTRSKGGGRAAPGHGKRQAGGGGEGRRPSHGATASTAEGGGY